MAQQKYFLASGAAPATAVEPVFSSVAPAVPDSDQTEGMDSTSEDVAQEAPPDTVRSNGSFLDARYVGQVLHLYLIFEVDRRLALVDMHAAHERVMFYRLMCQFLEGRVQKQGLLVPETVQLPPGEMEVFCQSLESLERLGFEMDRFGDDTIVLRALPAILGNVSGATLLRELLAVPEWCDPKLAFERKVDSVLARMACHRSVRSGRDLEPAEAYHLLAELERAETSAFCPHGRPVVVWLCEDELEQLFGRTRF